MVRKSYYIFVFTLSLIKMDPVFSGKDSSSEDSPYLDESVDQGERYDVSFPVQSPGAVNEENTKKPTKQKNSFKKRGACCFFLRKRKGLNDGK